MRKRSVDSTGVDHERRILTVPNLLSLVRLLCIPVFLWLLLGRDDEASAAFLLAGLGATDWVDGYIARRFHQVSELGKVLDPTADRILLVTAAVAIFATGAVPAVLAWPILVREVLVSVAAIGLAAAGARRIDVQWVGKAGAFWLMFALPLFLAGSSDLGWAREARALGWATAVPGIVLSWIAAAGYVPLARAALAEGRAPHPVAGAGVGSPDGRST